MVCVDGGKHQKVHLQGRVLCPVQGSLSFLLLILPRRITLKFPSPVHTPVLSVDKGYVGMVTVFGWEVAPSHLTPIRPLSLLPFIPPHPSLLLPTCASAASPPFPSAPLVSFPFYSISCLMPVPPTPVPSPSLPFLHAAWTLGFSLPHSGDSGSLPLTPPPRWHVRVAKERFSECQRKTTTLPQVLSSSSLLNSLTGYG